MTNNGQRRRATKAAAKVLGTKVAYNENANRTTLRRFINSWTKCESCGDRMLLKSLDAHLHKALLHVPEKATKAKKPKSKEG